MKYANAEASAPAYAAPENDGTDILPTAEAAPTPETIDVTPPEDKTDLNNEPIPSREPAQVDVMKKAEVLAELATHEGASYHAGMIAETIPEGTTLEACPVSLLRTMLTEMRVRGMNEG